MSRTPFGPPPVAARIKAVPEDFLVDELAAEPASGQGEHLHLWIEKRGLATTDVAHRLARWAGVAPVAVGYAGMKDKQAVTRQRFTVHLPGREAPEPGALEGDGLRVLGVARHARKLPRGGLAGNAFAITLRDLRSAAGDGSERALRTVVEERLSVIAARGVPNRFGVQRFGRSGDNVDQARRLFAGARFGRETRSMLLSAARSHLFNLVLDRRVADGSWDRAIPGEVCMLDGRRSIFGPEPASAALDERIATFDAHPTGPLWGRGSLRTADEARAHEAAVAEEEPGLCTGLEAAGLAQERRALRVRPGNLAWAWDAPDRLVLRFTLPPGCYATAVLAVLCGETGEGVAEEPNDGP